MSVGSMHISPGSRQPPIDNRSKRRDSDRGLLGNLENTNGGSLFATGFKDADADAGRHSVSTRGFANSPAGRVHRNYCRILATRCDNGPTAPISIHES